MRYLPVFLILLVAACATPDAPPSDDPGYLGVVRAYADALLDRGRDVYGAEHSPLVATTLDRAQVRLFEGEALDRIQGIPESEWDIRPHDRMVTGANPMHHENLYQTLYALTEATGEPRYAARADSNLAWFFTHTQSPVTGLLPWGEHMGWDFRTEAPIERERHGRTHELFRPWILWEPLYRLVPDETVAFARGLWDHQIADQQTGRFSRHARYDVHDPDTDHEFPRHGGFFISAWTEAYARTGDPVFLDAISTLLRFYIGRRDPVSDAIPAENAGDGDLIWPYSNLSYAIDLWDAAPRLPDSLGAVMRREAVRSDSAFLALPHDLSPEGRGFVTTGDVTTLQPVEGRGDRAFSDTWTMGYGDMNDALVAHLALLRYRQTEDPRYRALVLAAADRYLQRDLPADAVVFPGTMGHAISLLVHAHRLTGDAAYLDRADALARRGIALFLPDDSPLPRASSAHDHYEAITLADTFMMALLELWAARERPDLDLDLTFIDR